MADLSGPNNIALLAKTLGGLGFERSSTGPETNTNITIDDSVGMFEQISRLGETIGDDSTDFFAFNPSGISSITVTLNAATSGDYANYVVLVPTSGVTSIEGDIVGAWYGGDYRNASGRFGAAVESSAEGTVDIAEAFVTGDVTLTNVTGSRDQDLEATWQLDGDLVVFQVFGFQLDGNEPSSSSFSFDVSEVGYSVEITPESRSFSDIGNGALLFQNDLIFDQTHTGGDTIDTYVFGASRSSFSLDSQSGDLMVVSANGISNAQDTLINIERIQLTDGYLAFDTDGNAGQIYRL